MDPLHYRVLVHTLKNNGVAGDIVDIAEACWRDEDFVRRLKEEETKAGGALKGSSSDRDLTGRVVNAVSSVSSVLRDSLGVRLRTFRKSKYRLEPIPKYRVVFKPKRRG